MLRARFRWSSLIATAMAAMEITAIARADIALTATAGIVPLTAGIDMAVTGTAGTEPNPGSIKRGAGTDSSNLAPGSAISCTMSRSFVPAREAASRGKS